MDSRARYFERPVTPAEVYLYNHLMRQARTTDASTLIDHFQQLFVHGVSDTYPQVVKALQWIVNAPFAPSEFNFILNRSYYIVINAWCEMGHNRMHIPALVDAVLSVPVPCQRGAECQQLQQLVQVFVDSEQYQALRRVALTIRPACFHPLSLSRQHNAGLSLETIMHRYPYVYEYHLLTRDSTIEQRQTIQTIQQEAQSKYDLDLSRYMAYHQSTSYRDRNVAVLPAENPTLLSNEQLNYALFHYKGKIDGKNTQRDLANRFLTYCRWARSYFELKKDLYRYLTMTFAPLFKGQRFGQKLRDHLQATLSEYDSHPPTTPLLNETCRSLLNFLVVENLHNPDHRNFIDLIGNLGTTLTISLLLKILLICGKAKPWVEHRFAILFNHYSDRPQGDVQWLVESMETLNVAMSTNFSRVRGLGG